MKFLILIFTLFTFNSFCQTKKEFETKIEKSFDFGIKVQNDWKERNQLLKDLEANKKSWDNLSIKETELFEKYDETYSSMWDIEGGGCSWYCGAGNYTVKASSYLKNQKKNSYDIKNIKDFSYQTAWVEGVKNYGIGEFIEFTFESSHPRITVIKIANGYIKNKMVWKNNSRVKKLKVYVDNKVYGIINLKDVYALQTIKLEKPIGHSDREDYKKLQKMPKWKIRFEILDIYKGNKYKDTAISEIFFDGIDVH